MSSPFCFSVLHVGVVLDVVLSESLLQVTLCTLPRVVALLVCVELSVCLFLFVVLDVSEQHPYADQEVTGEVRHACTVAWQGTMQ